jgi:tetrahydromethanopterin S-methyltransferase subunit D
MTMGFKSTDIGGEVALGDISMSSQASAGVINGAWVDTKLDGVGPYDSCFVSGLLGNITGAPTGATMIVKLQDALDGSGTGVADYKPDGINVAASKVGINEGTPVVGTHDLTKLNAQLKNSRRFVRAVATIAFNAGTAPKGDVALALHLGGSQRNPVTDPNA